MDDDDVMEPTHWRRNGWEARVVVNEDGDGGWAVEMRRVGDEEPALVGPWTMGRDKKNPKPLDHSAFMILIKTASDVLRRHEQQAHARRHRTFGYHRDGRRIQATLDLAGDDDDPYAMLVCTDEITGEELRSGRVALDFKLNAAQLDRFIEGE